ncbi:serine--tRNA ligase [Patescibacteria group bacterium]|nr:serine--tRNA ligase [Patescibacteria group bacterium]
MLDINFIREHSDIVKKSITDRRANIDLDQLLKLDGERRELIAKVDALRAKRNGAARKKDYETGKKIKGKLGDLEKKLNNVVKRWDELMLKVPNILLPGVPIGNDDKNGQGPCFGNKIIKKAGELPKFSFKPKDHIELGELLNIIDFERGVKVGGFRGYFLKNEGAKLHWAVLNFALDNLIQKGFTPVIPPVINRRYALTGGGQFPWGEEDTYKVGDEDFLVGTAEIPLMAMHSGETFDIKDLPKKYVGISPCFRTEIGSYGKDTKGLYRVHEFYKVEQVILCEADEGKSLEFFKELQNNSEDLLQKLDLSYQVLILSSTDCGKKAAMTYDIETWMPGRGNFGETHSNSVVLDFQTRRLKIKYSDKQGLSSSKVKNKGVKYCHALNNTAIASPRILIALLENFQQKDGSVKIPEVLQKYTGFSEIKPK